MHGRKFLPFEMGVAYGMLAGAALGVLLFSLTSEPLLTGVGITLGYGIGATLERRNP